MLKLVYRRLLQGILKLGDIWILISLSWRDSQRGVGQLTSVSTTKTVLDPQKGLNRVYRKGAKGRRKKGMKEREEGRKKRTRKEGEMTLGRTLIWKYKMPSAQLISIPGKTEFFLRSYPCPHPWILWLCYFTWQRRLQDVIKLRILRRDFILDYPSKLHIITRVLPRERRGREIQSEKKWGWTEKEIWRCSSTSFQDGGRAMSQGMQKDPRSWKWKGNGFSTTQIPQHSNTSIFCLFPINLKPRL